MIGSLLLLGVIALAETPHGTDLWSYQAYGRIVAEYGANPYVDLPLAHPGDEVMARVNALYLDLPSAYGPVFVILATGVALVTGTGELAGRLGWQLIAGIAVVATAELLRRSGRSGRAVAAFALHPIVAYQLIHLAHNDALAGLAILGGCVLAERDRTTRAALLFSVAALIKGPSGIAWVVFVAWLLMRRRLRDAGVAAAASAALATATLAPFGIATALAPMLNSRGTTNATTIWNAVRGDWITFVWRPIRGVDATAGPWLSTLAILVPLAIAIGATYLLRDRPLHEPLTVGLLAWLVLSLYPSAWYYAWVLPLASMWAIRPRLAIGAQIALYQIATQSWLFPVAAAISGDGELGFVDHLPAPLFGLTSFSGLGLIAWLVFRASRGRRAVELGAPDAPVAPSGAR